MSIMMAKNQLEKLLFYDDFGHKKEAQNMFRRLQSILADYLEIVEEMKKTEVGRISGLLAELEEPKEESKSDNVSCQNEESCEKEKGTDD